LPTLLAARFNRDIPARFPDIQENPEVRRGQQAARLFRPFDKTHRVFVEIFPETRLVPLIRIIEAIKIKVI
jgi:hypothetical protein